MKKLELKYKRFGALLVVRQVESSPHGKTRWLCDCDCGKQSVAISGDLISGKHASCGCLRTELLRTPKKHGAATGGILTKAYSSWKSMKNRCTNPKCADWKNYGGRGITICKRWLDSFENSLNDMGECPSGLTLERNDNSKGYEASNCCWETRKHQANNRRKPETR